MSWGRRGGAAARAPYHSRMPDSLAQRLHSAAAQLGRLRETLLDPGRPTAPVMLWGSGAGLAALAAGLLLAASPGETAPAAPAEAPAVAALAVPAEAGAAESPRDPGDVVALVQAYRTEAASLLALADSLRKDNDALRRRMTAMEAEISGLNANTLLKGRIDALERTVGGLEPQVSAATVAADAAARAATAARAEFDRIAAAAIPPAAPADAAEAATDVAAAAPAGMAAAPAETDPAPTPPAEAAAAPAVAVPAEPAVAAAPAPEPPADPTMVAAAGPAAPEAQPPDDAGRAEQLALAAALAASMPQEGEDGLTADPLVAAATDPLVTAAIPPLIPDADAEEDDGGALLPPPGLDPADQSLASRRSYLLQGNRIVPLPPRPRPADAPNRSSFGLDIGGAPDFAGAQALWAFMQGTEAGALGANLKPRAMNRPGAAGNEVRLVLGPFADAADAATACARLARAGTPCSTTLYAGRELTAP